MKTIRILLMIFACVLYFPNNTSGQIIKQDVVVTIDHLDYEPWCPGLGIVTGTYTYAFSIKLSKEGYLEKLSWHVKDSNLRNEKGDKVIIVDSGHDYAAGFLTDFFNNANFYNSEYWNCPEISYSLPDGWIGEYLPQELPAEGMTVNMSGKMLCKGVIYSMPILAVIKINANGVTVVNFVKP